MTIKFTCPHCRKPLRVKDHLAGRKAQCPGCRKPLTVPALLSKPADVETIAAAALSEEPKATPPVEQATIEFRCFYCDEQVRVGADLAGKQTPCPECRRIIKVPVLEKTQPKDWRKMDRRLPAAARSDVPVPEGAWDTASIGVSRQALVEAQAIPQVRQRLTVGQWIRRGTAAAAGILVLGAAVWMVVHSLALSRQSRALAKALQYLEPADKLSSEAAAEIHRGAGEYYLRTSRASALQARDHFQQARAAILQANVETVEREAFLIDLALAQIDLGGDKPDVENGTRLPWEEANKELRQTWQNLTSADGRAEALRPVTRKLLAKNQGGFAPALAALFPDESSDLLAVVGLEMLRAKQEQLAEMLAAQALQNLAPPVQPQAGEAKPPATAPAPAPSLIALWLALGKPDQTAAASPAPEGNKEPSSAILIGNVKGLVYQRKLDQARERLRSVTRPEDRFPALLALATAAEDCDQAAAVRPELEEAFSLVEGELKSKAVPPWQLVRLARAGVKAGLAERVQAAARVVADPGPRGRMQLEVLRGRLEANKDRTDDSWMQIVDAKTPAYPNALELLARHNARYGAGAAMQKAVESWEEKLQPFGYLGLALGLQDRGG
jgi:hypothetical protein